MSIEVCESCVNNSAVEIIRRCPNRKVATLLYDYCTLRYSNTQSFSQVDSNPRAAYNTADVSDADANHYNRQLGNLLKNLSTTAVSEVTKFAVGSTDYTDFNDIYGLAMCTRDLSSTQCFSCLQNLIRWIPSCCNNSVGAHLYTATCNTRFELYTFFQFSSPPPPPPVQGSPPVQVQGSPPVQGTGNGKSINVVAIVVPAIVAVILTVTCAYFLTRRIRKNGRKRKPELIYENDSRNEDSLQFDLNTIRAATDDFSDANKLGEGGFGAVYKGELLDGQEIAVKRLSKNSRQGSLEFKNEVVLLHKLQHRNLVRLLGFCLAGEEKLLIYEYVPNRSLDKYIFEYVMRGQFSVKSDVFSFGVLVLEIISGQKNNSFHESECAEDLLTHAWRQWVEGSVLELIEPTLRERYSRNEVMRCIHIGLLCVQEDIASRPTMASVVLMLNSYSIALPLPTTPAFFVGSRRRELGWKTGEHGPNTNKSSQSVTPDRCITSFMSESITELYPR
ncbi:hypothetical protein IFM89_018807 [Coptis chinensis]|uniref:Cysteine-rich receptor-like protein kinase n=1 Tax=Coptis chinensis TaxID=261450 RepID=A0A835LIZ1_9MAGN|nr:hypothetical protein IFM89_018807 [Coptis chinensis]